MTRRETTSASTREAPDGWRPSSLPRAGASRGRGAANPCLRPKLPWMLRASGGSPAGCRRPRPNASAPRNGWRPWPRSCTRPWPNPSPESPDCGSSSCGSPPRRGSTSCVSACSDGTRAGRPGRRRSSSGPAPSWRGWPPRSRPCAGTSRAFPRRLPPRPCWSAWCRWRTGSTPSMPRSWPAAPCPRSSGSSPPLHPRTPPTRSSCALR